MHLDRKARNAGILGVFERRATPRAGCRVRPNADGLSPRAAKGGYATCRLIKPPTIALMKTSSRDGLPGCSPAKRVLLERAIRKRNANFGREPVIRPRPGRDPGRCRSRNSGSGCSANSSRTASPTTRPKTFRIEGPLDLKALQRALDEIVTRHGDPADHLSRRATASRSSAFTPVARSISHSWICGRTDSARDHEAQQILREAIRRPFDLSTDLMLRAFLRAVGG